MNAEVNMQRESQYLELNNKFLFSIASAPHQNFYENWLPGGTVIDNATAVRELMRRLGALL